MVVFQNAKSKFEFREKFHREKMFKTFIVAIGNLSHRQRPEQTSQKHVKPLCVAKQFLEMARVRYLYNRPNIFSNNNFY